MLAEHARIKAEGRRGRGLPTTSCSASRISSASRMRRSIRTGAA